MERPFFRLARLITPRIELKTMTARFLSIVSTVRTWIANVSDRSRFPGSVAVGVALVGVAGVGAVWMGATTGFLFPDDAARATLTRAQAERETENAAFTTALLTRQEQTLEVARGESLALVLARADIPWSEINPAVDAVSNVFNPRRMRPGQSIEVFYEPRDEAPH